MIPRREHCYLLMEEYGMLPNIVAHSKLVHRVALLLVRHLNSNGCNLDEALVEAGALLHDITKTQAIKTGENHSETGAALLNELGFPQVAEVVAQHVNVFDRNGSGAAITEAEVVNYADKRVMHDQLVGLTLRFRDIRKRYGSTLERVERITRTEQETQLIEKKLFAHLTISPGDVERLIHEKN